MPYRPQLSLSPTCLLLGSLRAIRDHRKVDIYIDTMKDRSISRTLLAYLDGSHRFPLSSTCLMRSFDALQHLRDLCRIVFENASPTWHTVVVPSSLLLYGKAQISLPKSVSRVSLTIVGSLDVFDLYRREKGTDPRHQIPPRVLGQRSLQSRY